MLPVYIEWLYGQNIWFDFMPHDEIRTPLNGMMAIIEMLADLPNITLKQQKEFIYLLSRAGEHLKKIFR